ncbi:hypothetical protein [Pseudonocardia endophytica]|uniref:hypothetical protein n=1 Tax=Pseudonocardia endophytica TaxID=401976 RepID=UPI001043D110|nr:hypothetical protein [Pseudonocardia endophytica]
MGGVDGASLGGVHGGGVGERDVLGDVAGGQLQGLPRGRTGGAFDGESAVLANGGDAEGLPVQRDAVVALEPGQVPGVRAGLDDVADPGDTALRAVSAERHTRLVDEAESDEVGAQGGADAGGVLVRGDQQQ